MDYKYNEHKYAELIYQKGFQTKHIPTELRLLALYYRDILELRPKERREKIYIFCQNYIPNYNKVKHFKMINRALKQSLKMENKLITVNSIPIYGNEINFINSLDLSDDHKKVLFALLVYKKLSKIVYDTKHADDKDKKDYNMIFFNGGNKIYNNIKNISNISPKYKLNDDIVYDLSQYKLKDTDEDTIYLVTVMNNGLILLNYLDELKELDNIAIEIKNFNGIGWYLDYYNNVSGIKLCKYCNQPFKKTKNRQEYCSDDCKTTMLRQQKLEWDRKNRSKSEN